MEILTGYKKISECDIDKSIFKKFPKLRDDVCNDAYNVVYWDVEDVLNHFTKYEKRIFNDYQVGGVYSYIKLNSSYYADFVKAFESANKYYDILWDCSDLPFSDYERLVKKTDLYDEVSAGYIDFKTANSFVDWFEGKVEILKDILLAFLESKYDDFDDDCYLFDYFTSNIECYDNYYYNGSELKKVSIASC